MVILYLIGHEQAGSPKVTAGEFTSHRYAKLFWEKFHKFWPQYEIKELDGHVEPDYVDGPIPVEALPSIL